MPRKILDIEIDEISVVDSAANRKKFFIKKGAIPMDELFKTLQSFLGADVVKEDELKKVPLSEEQAAEIQAAVATLAKYKADFPDDILAAVQSLAKAAVLRAPLPEVEVTIEKIGARLSKATLEDLKKIKELLDKLIPAEEAKDEEKTKKYAGVDPAVAARLAKLDTMEKAENERIQKAAADKEASLTATLKKLQDEVEALKKVKGVSLQKKAEAEPEAEALKKKDDVFGWPSLAQREEA
jgi:gamma-glutamylcysteine synthetase